MVVIDNLPVLRRHLGLARSGHAIDAVAARIARIAPAAKLAITGRDRIELVLNGASHDEFEKILSNIESACEAPFAIGNEDHRIELLIGASTTQASQCDDLQLVEDAEHALEDARTARRPMVRMLAPGGSVDRIALKRDLGAAILNGSLFIEYQPKVHLRRQQITGIEALLRWRHPTRGMILPSDFIPIAEESRDIVALTLWTLRKVIDDQRALSALGFDQMVFVNVAGVLLGDVRFVGEACRIVSESGARIGFEITETSVIRDPDSAIANLKVFADLGIVVAIDDYGAGLSSLAYLKQLPARELKIDKLFVTNLSSSHRDPLIVRSTIDLAHALDMEVVAEGVETPSTLALLSVMGCDMAQGYFISRPICFEELVVFLRDYRPVSHKVPAPFIQFGTGQMRG